MTPARAAILLAAVLTTTEARASAPAGSAGSTDGDSVGTGECFLLYEIGVGEIRRAPSEVCRTRVTPASTFKIPHALAALDAGVVSGPDETFKYDGSPMPVESWKRDHTLASAIQHSVVWYFQRVATKLGLPREREYLRKFAYGNEDADDRLTSFWLGGSLVISPEEQERFLLRLYQDALPVSRKAMSEVREMLRQPAGRIVSANGERPFGPPWPEGTVVEAKTGRSADRSGRRVLWLVGRVGRGDRSWIFVSCVITTANLNADAAIDLAARSLHEEHVL